MLHFVFLWTVTLSRDDALLAGLEERITCLYFDIMYRIVSWFVYTKPEDEVVGLLKMPQCYPLSGPRIPVTPRSNSE